MKGKVKLRECEERYESKRVKVESVWKCVFKAIVKGEKCFEDCNRK